MNSVLLPLSVNIQLPSRQSSPRRKLQFHCISTGGVSCLSRSFPSNSCRCLHAHHSSIAAMVPSDEGPVSVMNFEDFMEKDWSFLDFDESNPKEEHKEKIAQIISAGGIEGTSRVLVSIGSEEFVEQLVDTSPCSLLLLVHDSLFLLACIKEKYDKVKCWQGELIHLPKKWAPLDVVFLYFLPALPFKLDQVFGTLAKCCSQGARVVISHPQGREVLDQQRKEHQDVIVSELPDKVTLQKVASDNRFEMVEFVDDSGLYLAVLRFSGAKD